MTKNTAARRMPPNDPFESPPPILAVVAEDLPKNLPAAARAEIERLRDLQKNNRRLLVTIPEAATMLGLSVSRIRELLRTGELPSVLDGHARRVCLAPLYARLIDMLLRSTPVEGKLVTPYKFNGVRPRVKRAAR
jgi:excisionase family DNA binding protein